MDFLRKNLLLLVIYALQMISQEDGKPDLDFFMNAECPASKPIKCPPYAKCHDFMEYCHKGVVKSCFPSDISTNDTAIFQWCLHAVANISSLLDATCQSACPSKIAKFYLDVLSKQEQQPTVSNVTNNTGQYSNSCDCPDVDTKSNDYIIAVVVLFVCLLASMAANCYFYMKSKRQSGHYHIRDTGNIDGVDYMPESSGNRGNDKEKNKEEPGCKPAKTPPTGTPPSESSPSGATPTVVITETDRNTKQPRLNDSNLTVRFRLDSIHSNSSKTQNEGPINQLDQDGSTRNSQEEQTRNNSQRRRSVGPSSLSSFTHRFDDTSEESTAFISKNQATEAAGCLSQGKDLKNDLSIN